MVVVAGVGGMVLTGIINVKEVLVMSWVECTVRAVYVKNVDSCVVKLFWC